MTFISIVTFVPASPGATLPTQATIRLWGERPVIGQVELASKTVTTVNLGTAANFQLPQPVEPVLAFTVHAGQGDLPNALLRSGSLAHLPPGATERSPSSLIGPPTSLTQADLSKQVSDIFANGPLEFSWPLVSTFIGSVTVFIEVDSGTLTALDPQTQRLSLSFSGQLRVGKHGPKIGYTAALDVTVSGSRDALNPADVVSVAVVPGSLRSSFAAGSVVGASEAEALNVLQFLFDGPVSALISQQVSSRLNASLARLALSALQSTSVFQALPALPPAIVLSVEQVTVSASSVDVTICLGALGDVLEILFAAIPPPPQPSVQVACAPLLARTEEQAKRRFTVTATYQGQPVSGNVYYPTHATLLGRTNTPLDAVVNGVTVYREVGPPDDRRVVAHTTYPDAYVVPDPGTGHPALRCALFAP